MTLEDQVADAIAELEKYIDEAVVRTLTADPVETQAIAVAFMALIDFLGPDAAHTTVSEFFVYFAKLFNTLTK